jgi:hypothetical protein
VPLLALSKLNPRGGASRKAGVVQASRVPAANFSTMDRSPSKAYSGEPKGCSSSRSGMQRGAAYWICLLLPVAVSFGATALFP